MLIADVNEFHPLTNGRAYATGHASDGSAYSVVILRATYSTSHVDAAYASSLAQARSAGLLVGHYGYMTQSADAAAQGTFFGNTVRAHGGLRAGDTIWCDCEEGAGDQTARVEAFLAAAHAVLHDPLEDEGAYSGASFWAAHLASLPGRYRRWVAAYGASRPALGEQLFQFTDAQAMPGIAGNCDCSIFTGTVAQFRALFAPTPTPAGAETGTTTDTSPAPSPKGRKRMVFFFEVSGGKGGIWLYDSGTRILIQDGTPDLATFQAMAKAQGLPTAIQTLDAAQVNDIPIAGAAPTPTAS